MKIPFQIYNMYYVLYIIQYAKYELENKSEIIDFKKSQSEMKTPTEIIFFSTTINYFNVMRTNIND